VEGLERCHERRQLAPVLGQTLRESTDGLQVPAVLESSRIGRELAALPVQASPFEP
jgi:hypothetical protein